MSTLTGTLAGIVPTLETCAYAVAVWAPGAPYRRIRWRGPIFRMLREGIRLVEQREAEDKARIAALRAAIRVGDEDIAAGRSKVFKGKAELRRHLSALGRAAIAEGAGVKRRK